MLRCLVILIVMGCGNVVGNAPRDAGTDDSPAPRCDPSSAFGPPIEVTSIDTGTSTDSVYLSPDELTIWFSSIRSGSNNYDVFQASRSSVTSSEFRGIQPVAGINTPAQDRRPAVTSNGLRMFVSMGGGDRFDIAAAERVSSDAGFGALHPVPGVSSPDPTMVSNGGAYTVPQPAGSHTTVLYFHSNIASPSRLYRSEDSGSGFRAADAVAILELDPQQPVFNPVVTPDELTLYFTYADDIYVATRATLAQSFQHPTALSQLSSTVSDGPDWISEDDCVLYFTRRDPSIVPLGYRVYHAIRGRAGASRASAPAR